MIGVNDPHQIRVTVEGIVDGLPDVDLDGEQQPAADIDGIAARLEEAHQVLVDALESVEKG